MTEEDLRINYKQETGKYPTYSESTDLPESEKFAAIIKYVKWLEEKVIESNKFIRENI